MKKILIIFILVSVVLGLYSEENILWCKKILFNEPTTHVIQEGDYFSKLSNQYYGTSKYWRELALINRAPNKNLIFPGERVVIPNLDAIKKLQNSRSLTAVNEIVKDQEIWIAKNSNVSTSNYALKKAEIRQEETNPQTEQPEITIEETVEEIPAVQPQVNQADNELSEEIKESSIFPLLVTGAAIILVVGIMSLFLYRRKKKYEMEEFEPSVEEEMASVDEEEADEEMAVLGGESDDDDEVTVVGETGDEDDAFSESLPERERAEVQME